MQFCFAMEIRGSAKLILGSKDEPRWMEERWQVLTSCDVSSLVIDSLCDQARGQDVAVACFYFDFAAQKEQSSTGVLGALLKQVVSGLDRIPGEIVSAYEDHRGVIGGRRPQLSDVVRMLQAISSQKRTFICIDALDECVARHQVKILGSLDKILQDSPGTRIFVTGRPHVQAEVGERLAGRVASVSITSRREDIIGYLHTRLDEDTTRDAMDSRLKADILKRIPDHISEMYVQAQYSGNILGHLLTDTYLDSCWSH